MKALLALDKRRHAMKIKAAKGLMTHPATL
jgi:hypothetical protein